MLKYQESYTIKNAIHSRVLYNTFKNATHLKMLYIQECTIKNAKNDKTQEC